MGTEPVDRSAALAELALLLRRPSQRLEDLLAHVTEMLASTLDVELASVWRSREDERLLQCADLYDRATGHGIADPRSMQTVPDYARALATSRFIDARDARRDPRTRELEPYLRARDLASVLHVPLFLGPRPLGVLCVETRSARAWSVDDATFATSVADQCAMGIAANERDSLLTLYRSAVDDQTDILIRSAPSGTILLANRAAGEMFGKGAEALRGRSVFEFAPVASHGLVREAANRVTPDEPLTRYRHPISVDGAIRANVIDWTLRGFFGADGGLTGFQAIGRDLSEREIGEERLREAQRLEALAIFAGGMAHDVNNLLTPILLLSDAAVATLPPELPEVDDLREVVRAALRARDLVRQVLMFARTNDTEPSSLLVEGLVTEAVSFVSAATPHGIRVRSTVDAECGRVRARRSDLFQILSNLSANAVQAMPDGGELTIAADRVVRDGDPMLRIVVGDTGEGIPPEVAEKIFDPFFTTKPPGVGTGLGLSVTRRLVDGLGGSIRFESVPNEGTVFTVLIPALPDQPEPLEASVAETLAGNERVLVVDDDAVIASSLQDKLQPLGYRVTARTSPDDALATFQATPSAFDLLVTDLVMPDMTGEELVRRVRDVRPDLPVVMVSSFDPDPPAEPGPEISLEVTLHKPFRLEDVALAMRRAIERQPRD
ncbi:MAG: ATP-binding protein [Sandaracinaceae bacterium]